MAESLKGKVAVISGAGSGFAKATAELFAKLDQVGLVLIDINEPALKATADVCQAAGSQVVALPGDTSAMTLAAIIADEMAIGVINKKTTAARLIPVPGKKAGDHAHFGGLLGESTIMSVNNATGDNPFLQRGGLIPSPIHSLTN